MLKRSITVMAVIAVGLLNASAQNKDRVLSVMTRNLDAGSDFGFVTSATVHFQNKSGKARGPCAVDLFGQSRTVFALSVHGTYHHAAQEKKKNVEEYL